jgi:hypothetical protein
MYIKGVAYIQDELLFKKLAFWVCLKTRCASKRDALVLATLRDRRIQKKKPKTRKSSRKRRQLKCHDEFDCYRGQYCATDKSLCFDEGHQKFGEECTRNGGNFHKILHRL